MQRLQTANTTTRAAELGQSARAFLHHWRAGRRGLIVAGLAIIAVGLALGWNWLTAIGVAPIIVSLAPCAAMCAVGACAMTKGRSAAATPTTAAPAAVSEPKSRPAQPGQH